MYEENDADGKRKYTVAQIGEPSASPAKPSTATSPDSRSHSDASEA